MRSFVLYRHFNKKGKLLYVGKSMSIFNRISNHKSNSFWFEKISSITLEKHESEELLNRAERKAIEEEKPFYNIIFTSKKIKREIKKINIVGLDNGGLFSLLLAEAIQKDNILKNPPNVSLRHSGAYRLLSKTI